MALIQTYRRRKRQAAGAENDVFIYHIPPNVRVQLLMIIANATEQVCGYYYGEGQLYADLVKELREEIGTVSLIGSAYAEHDHVEFERWFSGTDEVGLLLDAIELWVLMATYAAVKHNKQTELDAKVARMNARLLEAGVGYELIDRQIVEKSNQFIHKEAVLPAFHFLSEARFKNANAEFRDAFEAFKNGEYEDCITDCLKAFESVMKVIAHEKKWGLPDNATAKALIAALFENEYVPAYMQSQFSGIRSMLESSVPTTRNKAGGHGKGVESRIVPKSLAAFQLHQTAAILVFLAELES